MQISRLILLSLFSVAAFLPAMPCAFANEQPLVTIVKGTVAADETRPESQTSFSKVLTREQFKTTTGSVADVLRQEAGVQLRQRGGLGSTSNIYLRGSDSQQVNVYLDGLLMNAAAGGGVDLSQFLLNGVSSVEIYPDVTPVQLGFPNLAGAVNIKTRKVGEARNDVQVGGGSFGARNAGMHLNEAHDAHSALLAAEYLSADNDYDMLNNNGTELNPLDDRVEPRENSQFDQANALFKYEYALDASAGVQLMLLGNQKDQALPSQNNSPENRSSLESDSRQLQTRYFAGEGDNHSWAMRLYYAQIDEEYDDRQSNVGLGSNWSRSETTTVGLNPSSVWRLDAHVITLSLDAKRDSFKQANLLRNEASPDWLRHGVNLGVQDEWQNAEGTWLVTPAASVFWIEDEGNVSAGGTQDDIRRSDRYDTARLGARYLFGRAWAIKANVARNVRVPSLYELMGDRGYSVGQPDLSPEKALATDFGFEYCTVATTASIVGFHRYIDDALVVSYDSRGVGRYSNIAEAEITGLELRLDQSLPEGFALSFRSTLQDPRDRTDRVLQGGKQLPNVYRRASSLGVIHRIERLENRLDYSVEEGGFYASGESEAIPDKRLLDYVVRYHLDDIQLAFEAKNLLDDQHEDFYQYPAPGRNYFVKATKAF